MIWMLFSNVKYSLMLSSIICRKVRGMLGRYILFHKKIVPPEDGTILW